MLTGQYLLHRDQGYWTESTVSTVRLRAEKPSAIVSSTPWLRPPGPAPYLGCGDLHPFNLLHVDGKLSAVIDFGDITSEDPATDLAVAWMLFDENDREVFRQAASSSDRPIDDATWTRARASALAFAVLLLNTSADNPPLHRVGEVTLATVISDFDTQS